MKHLMIKHEDTKTQRGENTKARKGEGTKGRRYEKKSLCLCVFVFILICVAMPIHAQTKKELTIEQCQQLARENYPLIKQFGLIEQSKEMTISNLVTAYFPKLSLTAIGGIMDGMPAVSMPGAPAETPDKKKLIGMAQLNQVIWDGGAVGAQKRIVRNAADVERANVEVSLYAIREQVNQLFFGILLIDEQLKQLDILSDNLSRNLGKAEVARANGIAYQSDVDALKVEILNTEQQRTELDAGKTAYLELLSLLIHKPLNNDVVLAKPVADDIPQTIEIMRPELQLFEQQRNLYNAQNDAITAQLMPKLGLMGFGVFMNPSVNLGAAKIDHILMGGLSLSWNVGALYTQNNDRRKIKNSLMQVDVQQETFLFNTNLKLKQSNNDIIKSKKLLAKDDEIIRLRRNIKAAAESKYEHGVCTMTDLIREINAEHLANQNKSVHEIQYLMNVYNYRCKAGVTN